MNEKGLTDHKIVDILHKVPHHKIRVFALHHETVACLFICDFEGDATPIFLTLGTMKNKGLFRLLVALIAAMALYWALPLAINAYLNANANRIVKELLTRTAEFQNHDVEFGNLWLDFDFRGTNLRMEDVRMWRVGDESPEDGEWDFDLHVEHAVITGFNWFPLIFRNEIVLDSALVGPGHAQLKISRSKSEDVYLADEKRENDYDLISVKHLGVREVSFVNMDPATDSVRFDIHRLNVKADRFVLSKEMIMSKEELFDVQRISGKAGRVEVHVDKDRAKVRGLNIEFDTDEGRLAAEVLQFINKLHPHVYVHQFAHEVDWIKLENSSLEVIGLDVRHFARTSELHADTVKVVSPRVEVYRDKRVDDRHNVYPKMVHEILRDLPLGLDVRTILLVDGRAGYSEQPDNESERKSYLFFDNLNAVISNATNLAAKLEDDHHLHVDISGRLMGKGQINGTFRYDLTDSRGGFTMRGRLGPMALSDLNPLVEPQARIGMESGSLTQLAWNIAANEIEGTGDVLFEYEGLKIKIMDRDYQDRQNVFRKVLAGLLNKTLVPSANPDSKGRVREGVVYAERDPEKFIFNYWWRLISSGLRSTLTGEDESDLREKAERKRGAG